MTEPEPIETNELPSNPSKRVGKRKHDQQGVAILMVLICLAIMFPFTASFNYKARVDWQAAINHGDDVRARAIQRGAVQLSVLLFELQRTVFNQKQFRGAAGAMDITQIAPYLMSIFGTSDGAEGLGALVGIDTTALNQLALDGGGSFEMRVEAESGKLNINCLAIEKDGDNTPRARTVQTLEALMLPTLYDPLFDEEKSDGQRYTRQDVLAGLVDYIDEDLNRFDVYRLASSSQDEQYRYTQLIDPYQARNARLDSIEELHQVQGIDDDWMAAFGSELTVYGGSKCKVNINFASPEQLALVIKYAVSADDRWKTEGENFLLMTMTMANFVADSRAFSLFERLDDFKELVGKPDQIANPFALLGDGNEDPDAATTLKKIPDPIKVRVKGGERKDTGDKWGGLQDIASVEPERIYRIEIITTVGSVRKRLSAVYDIQYSRSQTAGEGAWLYYRED